MNPKCTPKKYLSRFFYLAFAFLLGILFVAIYPFQLSEPDVTIDVFDRRYACGDCYIRFGIAKIYDLQTGEHEAQNRRQPDSPARFEGWDVLVLFKGDDAYLANNQEERFTKDKYCAWPIFRLKGQFKRRLIYSLLHDGDQYDGIYFDAHSGVAINTEPACKHQPRVIQLP